MSEPLCGIPQTRLIAPRMSLASCVRAYIARNTLECRPLQETERQNRFPAAPFCSITWFIAGETWVVEPTERQSDVALSQIVFGGPQLKPVVTYNPGRMHAFTLLLYPHALHKMTGLNMKDHVNRFQPLADVLGPEWTEMAQSVLVASDDEERIRLVERFFVPRWQQVDDCDIALGDWVRGLSVQVAATKWGRGVRNLQRRIKTCAGVPMRTLRRMHRVEQSFLTGRPAVGEAKVPWAEIAQLVGYADQAHLCRETREISGLSPTALAAAREDDESYWVYQIWS